MGNFKGALFILFVFLIMVLSVKFAVSNFNVEVQCSKIGGYVVKRPISGKSVCLTKPEGK